MRRRAQREQISRRAANAASPASSRWVAMVTWLGEAAMALARQSTQKTSGCSLRNWPMSWYGASILRWPPLRCEKRFRPRSQSPREGGASAVPRPRGATWRDAAGTRASIVRRCVTSDVNRPTLWWYCGAVSSARFDERQILPLAMFFGSFSWSFVYISLPFHIQRISTSDAAGTLTWTGWIMGITPLATVLTAPLWGRWAERGNPRTLNAMVQVTQGLAFLGTAAARTLIELFLCRIVLGVTGAASTFAFVSAGRSDDPLDVGGLIIFASAVAAALGSVLASRLADLLPERRLISGLLVLSSIFVVALAPVRNVWAYGALRFLQVLCIAPVFPLAVARIAQSGGVAIGVVNSARIGAAFVGPVLATTLLAWSAPGALYASLALIGLACVPLARDASPRRA